MNRVSMATCMPPVLRRSDRSLRIFWWVVTGAFTTRVPGSRYSTLAPPLPQISLSMLSLMRSRIFSPSMGFFGSFPSSTGRAKPPPPEGCRLMSSAGKSRMPAVTSFTS